MGVIALAMIIVGVYTIALFALIDASKKREQETLKAYSELFEQEDDDPANLRVIELDTNNNTY